MNVLRYIIRGCGDLPHVGRHPGTEMVLGFIAMGALAGAAGVKKHFVKLREAMKNEYQRSCDE
jgi:hypothetical protein